MLFAKKFLSLVLIIAFFNAPILVAVPRTHAQTNSTPASCNFSQASFVQILNQIIQLSGELQAAIAAGDQAQAEEIMAQITALNEQLRNQTDSLKNNQQACVDDILRGITDLQSSLPDLGSKIGAVFAEVNDLIAQYGNIIKGFNEQIDSLRQITETLSKLIDALIKIILQSGAIINALGSIAKAVPFLAPVVQVLIDFVNALVNAVNLSMLLALQEQLKNLDNTILNIQSNIMETYQAMVEDIEERLSISGLVDIETLQKQINRISRLCGRINTTLINTSNELYSAGQSTSDSTIVDLETYDYDQLEGQGGNVEGDVSGVISDVRGVRAALQPIDQVPGEVNGSVQASCNALLGLLGARGTRSGNSALDQIRDLEQQIRDAINQINQSAIERIKANTTDSSASVLELFDQITALIDYLEQNAPGDPNLRELKSLELDLHNKAASLADLERAVNDFQVSTEENPDVRVLLGLLMRLLNLSDQITALIERFYNRANTSVIRLESIKLDNSQLQ